MLGLSMLLLACAGQPQRVPPDSGAGGSSGGEGSGEDSGESDALWADGVLPLLQRDCLDCHDEWGADAEEVGGFLLEELSRGGAPFVVPGDAAGSLLHAKVASEEPPEGARMPMALDPVPAAQLEAVASWITEGAAYDETFRVVVMRVYDRHQCDDCHQAEWGFDDPVEVYAGLTEGEALGLPLIAPGDPDGSAFYLKMTSDPPAGQTMPLRFPYWTAAEAQAVADWIDAGARLE